MRTIYLENVLCFPGNDNLHAITARKMYTLRVDMADFEGEVRYAQYYSFAVASEDAKYRLTLGSYSGNAGDYDAYLHYAVLITNIAFSRNIFCSG